MTHGPDEAPQSVLGAPAGDFDVSSMEKPRINKVVFGGSAGMVLTFALWALISPGSADDLIGTVVEWITTYFGWWYFALATAMVAFVLFVCLSRYGRYRLGPEESRPEYSLFTWTAMLFAAGIGIDLMFYSVFEPMSQYFDPPTGEGESVESAREAVTWTLFHYGVTGWAMYAVMGMALAYFSFRHGLPLSIRSALYPIFGRRVHGRVGDAVDLAAVLGTIFGIATSLGIGIVQLNFGLDLMFGIDQGKAAQVGLIVLAVVLGTISAVSGLDKGIRRLSELNVLLSLALLLFVLFAGDIDFLLNALVMNIGDYVSGFGGKTMDTMAFEAPTAWMSSWTLFFWAWWIAWAPFVGLFLARISRGRTIRQFLVGVLIIPFTFILLWVSIFGNSALRIVRDGDEAFGELTVGSPEAGFYTFLEQYPWSPLVVGIATLTGLLYYVTSADSGALVMGNFTSRLTHPMADCAVWVRIFWSLSIGMLTLAMLFAGGGTSITTLTNATIIMGLPFSIVLALVAVGLHRSLRLESYKTDSFQFSLPGAISAGRLAVEPGSRVELSLGQRLRRSLTYPDRKATARFLDEVAAPALHEVATELTSNDLLTEVTATPARNGSMAGLQLSTHLADEPGFIYRLTPMPSRAPTFARAQAAGETYYRTEVHLAEGTQGYSINGYTREQLVGDVVDQYERHLSYLHLVRQSNRTHSDIAAEGAALPDAPPDTPDHPGART